MSQGNLIWCHIWLGSKISFHLAECQISLGAKLDLLSQTLLSCHTDWLYLFAILIIYICSPFPVITSSHSSSASSTPPASFHHDSSLPVLTINALFKYGIPQENTPVFTYGVGKICQASFLLIYLKSSNYHIYCFLVDVVFLLAKSLGFQDSFLKCYCPLVKQVLNPIINMF